MMFLSPRPSSPIQKLLAVLCFVSVFKGTHGSMSPSPSNPTVCPSKTSGSSCNSAGSTGAVFGVPEKKLAKNSAAFNAAAGLRGGELHEPKTLDEVKSLLLRAGSAGQLVVIDFTATYVSGSCILALMHLIFEDAAAGTTPEPSRRGSTIRSAS